MVGEQPVTHTPNVLSLTVVKIAQKLVVDMGEWRKVISVEVTATNGNGESATFACPPDLAPHVGDRVQVTFEFGELGESPRD